MRIGAGARQRAHAGAVLKRNVVVRVLEGRHLWGDFRAAAPGRSGWASFTLTVYPPGTNAAERRALQFWYSWPLVGALLALVAFAVGSAVQPVALVALVCAAYLGGIVAGGMVTRQLRARIRRLDVAHFAAGGGIRILGDVDALRRALDELGRLDARLDAGDATPLEYETGWWAVYDSLGAAPQATPRRRSSSSSPSLTPRTEPDDRGDQRRFSAREMKASKARSLRIRFMNRISPAPPPTA